MLSQEMDENREDLDLKQWNLDDEEEEILRTISMYIEMGYGNKEAFEETAKILQIDIEELIYIVETIKEHIVLEKEESER